MRAGLMPLVIGKKGEMGTTLSQEECGHVLPQPNNLKKGEFKGQTLFFLMK